MALFASSPLYSGQLEIQRDLGYVETDFGGVINQFDNAEQTVNQFTVTYKTTSALAAVIVSQFFNQFGTSETSQIDIDNRSYEGVFTGEYESTHVNNVYTYKATFIGIEL